MKRIIIGICFLLGGCASTTFYSETGTPVAIFQGDYTALRFEDSKQGIKWSANKVVHSTITPKTIDALSDSINPLVK